MTDDEKKMALAFLTMNDLSSQEKQMAVQQAQVNQLREAALRPGSGNTGFAGGMASGLHNISAMIGQNRQNQAQEKYAAGKQKTLADLYKAMGIDPNAPAPTAMPAVNPSAPVNPNDLSVAPALAAAQQQPQGAPPMPPYKKKDPYDLPDMGYGD